MAPATILFAEEIFIDLLEVERLLDPAANIVPDHEITEALSDATPNSMPAGIEFGVF